MSKFDKITDQFNRLANANIYSKCDLNFDTLERDGSNNTKKELIDIRNNAKQQFDSIELNINESNKKINNNKGLIEKKRKEINFLKKEIDILNKNNLNINNKIISKNQSVSLDINRFSRKRNIIIVLLIISILFFIAALYLFSSIKKAILSN